MTLNQIIGNKERKSRIDTELWKKMNEKYSDNTIQNTPIIEKIKEENIENKLEYYIDGTPKITLEEKGFNVIRTITQKEYDTLMQFYEIADWEWSDKVKPTKKNRWIENNHHTCIDLRNNFACTTENDNYISEWNIRSMQEFYNIQKIKPDTIKELNQYYDKYYPNRASKGPKNK